MIVGGHSSLNSEKIGIPLIWALKSVLNAKMEG